MSERILKPCGKCNCVSSQAVMGSFHYIKPLEVKGEPTEVFSFLKILLSELNRSEVIVSTENYLHALVRTRMGFIDDVEFLLQPDDNLIHVRSASRTGYFDWGVNRSRVEAIREQLSRR